MSPSLAKNKSIYHDKMNTAFRVLFKIRNNTTLKKKKTLSDYPGIVLFEVDKIKLLGFQSCTGLSMYFFE
jgi:hypothetical protein